MSATVSMLGLSRINPGILDDLVLPDGLDADLVKDNLLAETAELEVIYPDAIFMQSMIGRWSQKELPIWTRLYKTTQLEYNPIENYDRTEEWTEGENSARSVDAETTGNSTTDSTGSTNTSGTTSASDTGQKYVSAYNETDYTPTEKNTNTQTGNSETAQNEEGTVTVKTAADTTTNETEKRDMVRSGRTHGNIGVTTSQQMIEQERQISEYNIIDYIINSFKKRFCLLVY